MSNASDQTPGDLTPNMSDKGERSKRDPVPTLDHLRLATEDAHDYLDRLRTPSKDYPQVPELKELAHSYKQGHDKYIKASHDLEFRLRGIGSMAEAGKVREDRRVERQISKAYVQDLCNAIIEAGGSEISQIPRSTASSSQVSSQRQADIEETRIKLA